MHTTLQLIELAKQRLSLAHNLPLPMSDYRLAKLLGISTQVVSGWQRGKRTIGAEFAQTFATACNLPEAYVFACIEHERAKDAGVRSILEGIAAAFATRAAAVILSACMLLMGSSLSRENKAFASAMESGHYAESVYYVLLRRLRRYARTIWRGWHRALTVEIVIDTPPDCMA